jgi:hypothetical protein
MQPAQSQNSKPLFFPPSQGGINALSGAASGSPMDALFLFNMVPQEFGCAVRKGYIEHCGPIPEGTGVRTLIPYNADTGLNSDSKLFAVTSDGVYDVTTSGSTPTRVYEFLDKTGNAGWCSWQHYRTAAAPFLLLCDAVNGYITYNGLTDTWAVGSITGTAPDEEDFEFVAIWKNRVWLIEKQTGSAWYLPVGQVSGTPIEFNFGNKFKYGGYLKAIYNWTLDGGEGMDDYLVALSSAGDVVVYKGTDPNSPSTFELKGYYWIGAVPNGRRQGSDFGGELLLLSTYGIVQLSKLLAGLPVGEEMLSISHKINSRINAVMEQTLTVYGWEVKVFPREQLIFVLTPKRLAQNPVQFIYNTATRAWGQFDGVPMLTAESFFSDLYFGTEDNRIFRYAGHVDGALLDDEGASATAIEWSFLTTFQVFDTSAQYKRVQFLRPMFIGNSTPEYNIQARYDFDISSIGAAPPYSMTGMAAWDLALWNLTLWGSSGLTNQPPRGANGLGRHVALAVRGRSAGEVIYVGTDTIYDVGGML